MSKGKPSRWRIFLSPPIGDRVAARRSWLDLRLPFLAWPYYWLVACATPLLLAFGIAGLLPAMGLFFIGSNSAAVYMGFAVAGVLLAGMAAGWVWRSKVVVCCDVPARIECGRPFSLRYVVENHGKRTACDLAVETLPYPNRFQLRLRRAVLAALPGGQAATVESAGESRRRGRYRLPPLRWDSNFPFGIWRWGRTDWSERPLIVYPRYTPLAELVLPLGSRNRLELDPARQLVREAIEFHGCREFRTGDALRHVHPRSSARLGTPVVKEFQAEGRGRTAILVDTWSSLPKGIAGRFPDSVVEACLSLATAATECLARGDRVLELLVAGPGLYRFVSSGRIGFFEDVLDIMASVDPSAEDPLATLAPQLIEETREIQSVLLILGRWDRRRAELVEALEAAQVGVKTVIVSRRGNIPPGNPPPDATCLSARAVRRGEVATL